jgi:membrane protease YdiL (CAAX protease family)
LHLSTIVFLILVGLVLPLLAISSYRLLSSGGELPPRRVFFLQTLGIQFILGSLAILAASKAGIDLWNQSPLEAAGLLISGLILVAWLVSIPLVWNWLPAERRSRLVEFLPGDTQEKLLWALAFLSAAVMEEVAYRGVLFVLLDRWLGGWWPAVVVSSLVFAAAHMTQGLKSASVIVLFAFGLHVIVRVTGGLYTAMVAHWAYDVLAGVALRRLATSLKSPQPMP